jgi:hypothetical protein
MKAYLLAETNSLMKPELFTPKWYVLGVNDKTPKLSLKLGYTQARKELHNGITFLCAETYLIYSTSV